MRSRRVLVFLTAYALISSAAASGAPLPISFSDGTFSDADWSQHNPTGVSVINSQGSGSGNPGFYRSLSSSYPGINSGLPLPTILLTDAVFDPSTQGSISSVLYSQDIRYFSGTGKAANSIFSAGPALRQNNTFYIGTGSGLANSSTTDTNLWYSLVDYPLEQAYFARVSPTGPTQPDFSSSGSPIEFGFFLQSFFFGPGSLVGGYDNWKVTVNYVPEPATYVLAITGIVGLTLTGLRSKFATKRVKTIR